MSDRASGRHSELLLEVELREVSPRIWRQLTVSELLTLADLHEALQIVIGWLNCHLYEFERNGRRYTTIDEDAPPEAIDTATVTLRDLGLAEVGATLTYDYDFGDGWSHAITVIGVEPVELAASSPRCVAGRRSCPPEDCGGPLGYQELLEVLEDPAHPELRELADWLPVGFDPVHFDLREVNAGLDGFFGSRVN